MGLFGKRKAKLELLYSELLTSLFLNNKKEAIEKLTEIVKENTDDPIPYLWLGKLLEEEGEESRAQLIFENLARRPRIPNKIKAIALRFVARNAKHLGEIDKEIASLGLYSSLVPKDSLAEAQYLFLKAKEALKSDNHIGAIRYLEESIKSDPRFGDSYILLGDQFIDSNPKKSIRIWRRLLKKRPDIIAELGPRIRDVYERLGIGHRYLLFLRKLSNRSSSAGYPFLLMGRLHLELKEFEKAKEYLELAKGIRETSQLASIDLIELSIERWDQKQANSTIKVLNPPKMLWKCGICNKKVISMLLLSCPRCGNSTDIVVLTESFNESVSTNHSVRDIS